MSDGPLAPLGDWGKPASDLILKISDAVGGIFRPWQIKRVARAEAVAVLERAKSKVKVSDLQRRAFGRFLEEESRKQSNMEGITSKALPLLRADSEPQKVDNDWITNFFDKSRIVSDEDMQRLWSKILAGEANSPGSFSRRTVNIAGDLEKGDAELFTRLCGFSWQYLDLSEPLVYDHRHEVYNRHGINFDTLRHLVSLGLIQMDDVNPYTTRELPKGISVSYFGRRVEISFPNVTKNELGLGQVLLTRAGYELARICESKPVDGFYEYVYDRWAGQSLVRKAATENAPPGATNT